jgi:hypothetical protein
MIAFAAPASARNVLVANIEKLRRLASQALLLADIGPSLVQLDPADLYATHHGVMQGGAADADADADADAQAHDRVAVDPRQPLSGADADAFD